VLLLDLPRETGLLDLPLERALVPDVEVADELLRDRRATLDDVAALEVLDRGAQDALVVQAAMVVEAAILDGNGRLRDPGRRLVKRHGLAIPLGRDGTENAPVGRVDEGVLADRDRLQRGEVAVVEDAVCAREGGSDDGSCATEDDGDDCEDREAPRDNAIAAHALAPPAAVVRVERAVAFPPVPVTAVAVSGRHQ
jgi:hypothetical protein